MEKKNFGITLLKLTNVALGEHISFKKLVCVFVIIFPVKQYIHCYCTAGRRVRICWAFRCEGSKTYFISYQYVNEIGRG